MKKKKNRQILPNIVMVFLCAVIIVPLLLVLSVSISNERDISYFGYRLIPHAVDLAAYRYIFKTPQIILQAYKVTIIFSFATMVLGTFLMAMLAYVLSVPNLKGKSVVSFIIYFTMLFGGGLGPTYIVYTRYLHIGNTIWAYILPGLISPWYVFMMRTNMKSIPLEISESALIDGATDLRIFTSIILPLSKPVLATVALFTFLVKWNDWHTAMIYINDTKLMSLQYQLQRIMQNITVMQEAAEMGVSVNLAEMPAETTRMAMAVVVAGPALLIFPFFQKYFTRGLTVGSVKG